MEIIPAIDLKAGRCVRLRQGRAEDVTVYSEDPVAMARHWAREGADRLHVVDLDGAFSGRPVHAEMVGRIAAAIDVPVQVGGGIRTDEAIQAMLDAGVDRVVLGTRACTEPEALARLAARFGRRLAVGIDARDGKVQVRGWVEATRRDAAGLAAAAAAAGIGTLIYTDTATDGMLAGPNREGLTGVCRAAGCSVIASGGIASADDVRRLRDLRLPNLAGVIVGKALYEQRVTVPALKAAAC